MSPRSPDGVRSRGARSEDCSQLRRRLADTPATCAHPKVRRARACSNTGPAPIARDNDAGSSSQRVSSPKDRIRRPIMRRLSRPKNCRSRPRRDFPSAWTRCPRWDSVREWPQPWDRDDSAPDTAEHGPRVLAPPAFRHLSIPVSIELPPLASTVDVEKSLDSFSQLAREAQRDSHARLIESSLDGS